MGKSKKIGDKTYNQDENGDWYEVESPIQKESLTAKVVNGIQYHKDENGDWYEGEAVKKKETVQVSKVGGQEPNQDGVAPTPLESDSQLPLTEEKPRKKTKIIVEPTQDVKLKSNPITLISDKTKAEREYADALANENMVGASEAQKKLDKINFELKATGTDDKLKTDLTKELFDFPWDKNITKRKIEFKPEKYGLPAGDYSLPKILSVTREKDYPTYLRYLAQYKIGDLIEKNTGDTKKEVDDFLYTFKGGEKNFSKGVAGLQELEYFSNTIKQNVRKHIGVDNLGVEKEDTKKALGLIDEYTSSLIYKNYNDKEAKEFLQSKLNNTDLDLKQTNTQEDVFKYGVREDGTINYPKYTSDIDLDNFDLNSIASKLDLNNPAIKTAYDVYARKVGLDNALGKIATSPDEPTVYNNGHEWTQEDFENAAINYESLQTPLIAKQIESMGGQMPESMKGNVIQSFLNNPDVIEAAKTNPDLAKIYNETKKGFRFRYPESNQTRISTIISQGLEDMGETNWLVNIPTQEQVDNVVQRLKQQNKLSDTDVQDYEKSIRDDIGVLMSVYRGIGRIPFGGIIPEAKIKTAGVLENVQNEFNVQMGKSARSIEDFTGMSRIIGEKQRLYNILSKNATNVNLNLTGAHEISAGTGHILGFTIPLIAGGEILAGIKGGHYINSILAFEGHNRDRAIELFPGDTKKQLGYTLATTIGDATIGELLPTKAIGKAFSNAFKKDTKIIINNLLDGKITQGEAISKLKGFTTKAASLLGKNANTTAVMTAFGLYHEAIDKAFGATNQDKSYTELAYDAVNGAKTTFLTTPVLALLETAGTGTGSNKANHKVLWEIANDPVKYEKIINDEALINPDIASQKEEMLNNLKLATTVVKDLNESSIDITTEQKQKYLVAKLKQDIWMKKAANTSDPNISQKYVEKANEYQNAQKDILDNKDKADDLKNYNVAEDEIIEEVPKEEVVGKIAGTETTGTGEVLQTPGVEGVGEVVGQKVGEVNPLKDVESTTNALNNFRWDNPKIEKITEISPNIYGDFKALAEDYHKFKADGTNPELVKSVEDLLGKKAEIPQQKEAPKEGDKITLPPQIKGGIERTMVFNEGEWKQEVGDKKTNVGEKVKEQAQVEFDKPKEGEVEIIKQQEPKVEKKVEIKTEAEVPKTEKKQARGKAAKFVAEYIEEREAEGGEKEKEGEPKGAVPTQTHTVETIDQADTTGFNEVQNKNVNDAKRILKVVSKLVGKETGKELKLIIHSTRASAAKAVYDSTIKSGGSETEAKANMQNQGNKGWWSSSDGEIHLNIAEVASETIKHEVTHPILDAIAKVRPEIIDQFHKQLESLPEAKEIIKIAEDNYANYDKKGKLLNPSEVKVEAITDYIAKVADGQIKIDVSNFQKVKDYIVNLLTKIGLAPEKDIKSIDDLRKFAQTISEKFAKGQEIEIKDTELIPKQKTNLFSKKKDLSLESKQEENARTEKERASREIKVNSEKVQYNGTNAIGSRTRTESEQIASRKEAKAKIKNPETNASLKSANSYNKSVGLPEVTAHKYKPSNPVQQTKIAKLYPKLKDVNSPTYKETSIEKRIYSEYKIKNPEIFKQYDIKDYKDLVNKAYEQLIKETQLQYDALPVKVTFHEAGEGNYENNFEMLDDVHNFNHLWVYKGGDDHTALGSKTIDNEGLTANDKFRAVHDYYGHSVEGYQFGKDGEENAWIEHSKMFSPLAQWALSSETRGQNSWVNYSGVNDAVLETIKTGSVLKKEGKKLGNQEMINDGQKLLDTVYDDFVFAEQKAIILPPEYSDVSKFHTTKISEVPSKLLSKSELPQQKVEQLRAEEGQTPKPLTITETPLPDGARAAFDRIKNRQQQAGSVGVGGDVDLNKEEKQTIKDEGRSEEDFVSTRKYFEKPYQEEGLPNIGEGEGAEFMMDDYNATEENVAIKDLIPTQRVVDKKAINSKNNRDDNPIIIRNGKELFVVDGHHRIAQSAERGETTIKADIFDVTDLNLPTYEQSLKKTTKTEFSQQKTVEQLRAEEQAKLDEAIPNAEQYRVDGKVDRNKLTNKKDIEAFDKIYKEYDALITPLLKGVGEEKKGLNFSKKKEEVKGTLNGKPVTFVKQPENVEVVNGFYSPIEKRLVETKIEKQSANKWREIVGKGDEAKFTGVLDWLESLPPTQQVSKSEIQNWMKENRIEINEVVKGENAKKVQELLNKRNELSNVIGDYDRKINAELSKVDNMDYSVINDLIKSKNKAENDFKEADIEFNKADIADNTKYSQYQLPGEKTNYKEVLVTLPFKKSAKLPEGYTSEMSPDGKYRVYDEEQSLIGEGKTEQEAIEDALNEPETAAKPTFKSSHYDEPNILAHIRMNTRVDAKGNKVLHIEEFQSDWGQEGKKQGGFARKFKPSEVKAVTEKENPAANQSDLFWYFEVPENVLQIPKSKYATEQEARNYVLSEKTNRTGGVPEAPFVTKTQDWTKLAWKVALKEAVKEGADKITWTTGEQQNERYDLSKQIDKIKYERVDEVPNLFFVDISMPDGIEHNLEVENGIVREGDFKGKRLEDIIGKDIAKKILEPQLTEQEKKDVEYAKHLKEKGYSLSPKQKALLEGKSNENQSGTLKGDGLKIQGTGMKGFYGSSSEGKIGIVGEVAKSLFKQEPKTTELSTNERGKNTKDFEDLKESLQFEKQLADKGKTGIASILNKDGSYTIEWEENKPSVQHSIDITPEMKTQVESGMPMFSKSKDKKMSDMKDILKEYVDEGKSLNEIKEIMKDEFGDYYKDVEGIIDQAHQEMTTTSIKNAVTERERAERGLTEVEVEAKRSFGKVFDDAKNMVANGEANGLTLAAEIVKNPRPLKAEESAVLLIDRMRISNEYNRKNAELLKAQENGETDKADIIQSQLEVLEEEMDLNDEAARKSGYEQGLGLAARRMLIAQDYSLVTQMSRLKAANGGKEVPKQYQEQLKDLIAKLDEANQKLEKFEKNQIGTEKQKQLGKVKPVSRTPEQSAKEKENIKSKILAKWGQTLARIKAASGNIKRSVSGTPITPEKQAQLESIVKDVNDMVKLYAELGETNLKTIINNIHQDLVGDIPDLNKSDIEDVVLGKYDVEKVKTPLTKEKIEAQANLRKVKTQIDLLKEDLKSKQRSIAEKGVDYLHGWHRFAILSGAPSAAKIGTAALTRGIVTRGENIVGKALSLIPGIRQIAKKAPRQGGLSASAEAKAFTTWFDKMTMDDVRETMKTGMSSIDYLYGGKEPMGGKVPEWMEFFGRMHSAIKLLPKRAEFFRSLEMRTEHALANGKDVNDPMVQQEMASAAYNDAIRAIFMQDNPISSSYTKLVNGLEKDYPAFASTMKFIFPIVKVPVNYVSEQVSYLPPIAAVKMMTTLYKGRKGMSGEQADYFMRALKKGAIGTAFIFMGYMNPQALGGYYTGKRKEDELEAGDIKLFGVKLPHFMTHTPLLEMLQVGATMRRASDAKIAKGEEPTKFDGIPAIFKGEMTQVPFIGTGQRVMKLADNKTTDGFKDYAYSMGQSILEPQLMQNIADWTDKKEGETVKRKPEGFIETLKEGVPVLRQTLKEQDNLKLSKKEQEEYSNIIEKGINIPELNRRTSYRVKNNEQHPDSHMTEEEFTKFISLQKQFAKESYKVYYSEHKGLFDKLQKMIDAVPDTPKEKSELNKLKDKIQNKIDAIHNHAIDRAKRKLKLK